MASTPSHHSPSEQTLESLSALVDDEASEFEQRRLLDMDNPELEAKWRNYNLAGALMRKELADSPMLDLSASISAAIGDEPALAPAGRRQEAVGAPQGESFSQGESSSNVVAWKDWMAKSAIAASVALAVVAGVQFTQNGELGMPLEGPSKVAAVDPVVSAPAGFDLPAPVARNVSLGNLAEPQRKLQAAADKQAFLSNAQVEAELQQLFLEHAELSSENGKFGLMPMARAAKMTTPQE